MQSYFFLADHKNFQSALNIGQNQRTFLKVRNECTSTFLVSTLLTPLKNHFNITNSGTEFLICCKYDDFLTLVNQI